MKIVDPTNRELKTIRAVVDCFPLGLAHKRALIRRAMRLEVELPGS
jgi:hypothetical protein